MEDLPYKVKYLADRITISRSENKSLQRFTKMVNDYLMCRDQMEILHEALHPHLLRACEREMASRRYLVMDWYEHQRDIQKFKAN